MNSPEMGEVHRKAPALKDFPPVAGDEWKLLGDITETYRKRPKAPESTGEQLRGSGTSRWVTQLDERFKAP